MSESADVYTDLTCYDCGEYIVSTVRNGWATYRHEDASQTHPVRVRVEPTPTYVVYRVRAADGFAWGSAFHQEGAEQLARRLERDYGQPMHVTLEDLS